MVYEILSIRPSTKWSEYDPTVVCEYDGTSLEDAINWTKRPGSFVDMMSIDVYAIREKNSGAIVYTENYS